MVTKEQVQSERDICGSTALSRFGAHLNFALYRKPVFSPRIESMSIRLLVGIAAVAGVSVCGLLSTLISYKMVDQVNGKLPRDAQFSLIGWHFPKSWRLYREYRKLFPDGQLLLQVLLLLGLMVGCVIIAAWAIGFFGR
jgi:hypothetical protein